MLHLCMSVAFSCKFASWPCTMKKYRKNLEFLGQIFPASDQTAGPCRMARLKHIPKERCKSSSSILVHLVLLCEVALAYQSSALFFDVCIRIGVHKQVQRMLNASSTRASWGRKFQSRGASKSKDRICP